MGTAGGAHRPRGIPFPGVLSRIRWGSHPLRDLLCYFPRVSTSKRPVGLCDRCVDLKVQRLAPPPFAERLAAPSSLRSSPVCQALRPAWLFGRGARDPPAFGGLPGLTGGVRKHLAYAQPSPAGGRGRRGSPQGLSSVSWLARELVACTEAEAWKEAGVSRREGSRVNKQQGFLTRLLLSNN